MLPEPEQGNAGTDQHPVAWLLINDEFLDTSQAETFD